MGPQVHKEVSLGVARMGTMKTEFNEDPANLSLPAP